MNAFLKRSNALIASVSLLAALLGACANSDKKSTSPASAPGQAAAVAVGINTCVTCHAAVATEWLTSKHANDAGGDLNSPGVPTMAQIAVGGCASCHDPNGDSGNLTPGLTGNVARPVIGCETCHGLGSVHAGEGGTGPISFVGNASGSTLGSTIVSAQFVLCTSCHALLDSSGTATAAATHDPASAVTPTGSQYAITSTHFATAITDTFFGTNPITGYAMDYSSETVCTGCHDPHKNADIEREWAASSFALKTATGAWARNNWSTRPTCQRCHTTSGFVAYVDALRSGDAAQAQQILYGTLSTSPVPSAASWKPEMLLCQGCHTDNKGALRNPGAYTADYTYNIYVTPPTVATIYSVASHAYPDLAAGSNLCMPCHTGRGVNGDTIKNMNVGAVTAVSFANQAVINAHHDPAGAVQFNVAGYNYSGRDYTNPSTFIHDKIGSASAPNTGSNGPCVGCHMTGPGQSINHLFLPVDVDDTGTRISNIGSGLCFTCHGPNETSFLNMVIEEKGLFLDAQTALQYLLTFRGYYQRTQYASSFYPLRDKTGQAIVTGGSPTVSGIATNWTTTLTSSGTSVAVGDYIRIVSDPTYSYYRISAVVADDVITLGSSTTSSTLYTGASATVQYSIIQSTTNRNWLTQAGSGFVPAALTDTDTTGNTTGKNNMGAAFNLGMFGIERAAYVHNRHYAKKLIYDSIDWLDDNQLNYSVGTTLNTICSGGSAPTWCAGAMSYILPNGVVGFGVSAERP